METPDEADHIVDWNVATLMGWTRVEYDDAANGQAVCAYCHKLKTGAEAARGRKMASRKRQEKAKQRKHPGILE